MEKVQGMDTRRGLIDIYPDLIALQKLSLQLRIISTYNFTLILQSNAEMTEINEITISFYLSSLQILVIS